MERVSTLAEPEEEAPFLRRALRAAREGGAREVWMRALALAGYRRLTVYLRDLGKPYEPGPDPVTTRPLDDIDAYLALRPQAARADVEHRLARGDICGAARIGDKIVGVRWLAFGCAEIDYLGLAFDLPPDTAYAYDAWTRPDARSAGVNRALSGWTDTQLRARGGRRTLSAILPENRAARRMTGSLPLRTMGTIAVIRLPGGRRIPLRRGVPLEVLGAARPLR
jgi:hypothetical protein